MTTSQEVITDVYEGVGGPSENRTDPSDGFPAGPTDSGEYVIAYCGRHSSNRYPNWSKIPWGTKLKERNGQLYVFYQGRWTLLSSITPVTRKQIVEYHYELYGKQTVPDTWVFNDFGHMTCYLFQDINKNLVQDKNEKIHGEFIHTTPLDEARAQQKKRVILTESHGCVHVKPADIDDMIKKEYLKRGNLFIVHQYREKVPAHFPKAIGRPPFELHFYPGEKKIIIKAPAKR